MEPILRFLNTKMETPTAYGWFHLLYIAIVLALMVLACIRGKYATEKSVHRVVLITALVVIALEVYKQINFTFGSGDREADYQWYAFPFQFCSTAMYVGLLAGLFRKGKFHDALCAYLATYALFAGLCVMVYPGDVFVSTVGINIQTMVCHGSMPVVAAYLFASGHVKLETKTIVKALPVFLGCVAIACIMNEIAYVSGLLESHNFNMFYISPHCDPHLVVYASVQELLPFPLCLLVYIWGFTTAGLLLLLVAMGISRLVKKNPSRLRGQLST